MHIETFKRRRHTISLTPLIDVVFILLVFFMLATSFTDWRPITLATGTSQAAEAEQPPAVVRVTTDGSLHYQQKQYSTEALARRLSAARRGGEISAVIVQPDGDTPLAITVDTLDSLTGAGVQPMSLATGAAP